jgi:polyvinyl alcohol dehydrogenase (cytochrome)
MPRRSTAALATLVAIFLPSTAFSQDGQALFDQHCAACHAMPPEDDIPRLEALQDLDAGTIVLSLRDGLMRIQGLGMTPEQHVTVAEFISGESYAPPDPVFTTGLCATEPSPLPAFAASGDWNGWGGDERNRRFAAEGGLTRDDLPRLQLKWAFGVPGVTQSRSQPAVLGDRLFIASQTGAVYALDAETGCTHWVFEAESGVRTAISVGPLTLPTGEQGHAVYFADAQARAYAVDAQTGGLLWRTKVDDHPAARATGAPTLHQGRLYVVLSGVAEENAASMPDYECCTFRGSLTSIDATTGEIAWKTYMVPEPEPRGTSSSGKPLWGPAGSPIWAAPTIDAARAMVYVATGNAYADPVQETSDAVVAVAMETGEIGWINQLLPGDTWILGCGGDFVPTGLPAPGPGAGAEAERNPNCPEDVGPDYDFSASPMLVTGPDGRELLVVPQKAGMGYALDPDAAGRTVWEHRFGEGSPVGGVWGAATDGERAYFAAADQFTETPGGMTAVDLATGEEVWAAPPQPVLCTLGAGPCSAAQSAAVTAIPGAIFSGGADGGVRAYDAETGEVIWLFDANRAFETVNGVEAKGGSIDGPGPIVAGGMLYVTAGNGGFVGSPGNVLLAFEVGE